MSEIGIIGSGSWGTALSVLLHANGHRVTVWSSTPQKSEQLRTTRRLATLPDLVLPDDMEFTSDLETVMKEKDFVVMAVPSIHVRTMAFRMRPFCLYSRSAPPRNARVILRLSSSKV